MHRTPKEEVLMKRTRMLAVAGVATVCGAGAALASHVTQVDPATVPTGFVAAHTKVENIRLSSIARAVDRGRADVFIQHVRLAGNEATAWHPHPGPVFVEVVKGSLTYEAAEHGDCRRITYEAGEGFFDRGFGHIHRAVAGAPGPTSTRFTCCRPVPRPTSSPARRRRNARPEAVTATTQTRTTTRRMRLMTISADPV